VSPFEICSLNYAVMVERIKDTRTPFYRPSFSEHESAGIRPQILVLMKQCWAEQPSERPAFDAVAKAFEAINKGKSVVNEHLRIISALNT